MILRFAFLLGFSFLLSIANTAALQNSDKRASMLRAEKAMIDYSTCLLESKRREKAINEFLLIPDGHSDQNVLDDVLIEPDCAKPGEKLSFKGDLFRRSLYMALYNKYYRKTTPAQFSDNIILDYNQEVSAKYGSIKGDQLILRQFTDCAIRNNPVAAHEFIIAKPESSEENAFLKAASSALNECISEGAQVAISRSNLKAVMAEALYKLRTVSNDKAGIS